MRVLILLLLSIVTAHAQIVQFSGAPSSCNVGQDGSGWTTFTPSADTQIYYVSTSGSDAGSNTCLVQGSPCATLTYAKGKLRAGKPDWLLLKTGDTWTENLGAVSVSGQSSCAPMRIGSYGSGNRPIVKTTGNALFMSGTGGNYLAVTGIEFYAYTRDPGNVGFIDPPTEQQGIFFINTSNWLLFEDNKLSFYSNNMLIETNAGSTHNIVQIRRNIIVDSYELSALGHSQGLYTDRITALTLVENLFDHNGWNATVPDGGATVFNHNVYLQGIQTPGNLTTVSGPAVVSGNIVANASNYGVQVRSGGAVTNNLFVRNPSNQNIGMPTVQTATITQNTYLEGVTTGWGVQVFSEYSGDFYNIGTVTISSNIMTDTASATGRGIVLESGTTGDTVTSNIVCDWVAPLISDLGSGNTVSGNTTQAANCSGLGFPDPTRTVGGYYGSIGGSPATLTGFLTAARAQSKNNWNTALMANAVNTYIRAGFGL